MEDAEEDQEPVSHYQKRKRASLHDDPGEDKIEDSVNIGKPEADVVHHNPKPGKLKCTL